MQHFIQALPSQPALPVVPTQAVTLHINGQDRTIQIAPWTCLLDALREYCNLTGTKKGCDHGQCGACTVLVEGKRINACLTLAVMHEDHDITTIEGLADASNLHPLQQAFIDHDAFQCGYCTPGQICSAVGMIHENKVRTTADIQELMSGNICRCGAYPQIVDAISEVMGIARQTNENTPGTPEPNQHPELAQTA